MADPGVSTANFLKLLLGGAQQGADVFQQRQSQQQAQAPDLYLTLQRMMQQQRERQEDVQYRDRESEMRHSEITANRMRQAGIDYQNFLQQGIENRRADAALKSLEAHRKALELAAGGNGKGGAPTGPKFSDQNASLKTLLASIEESPESYDILDEAVFSGLPPQAQAGYSKKVTQERDDLGDMKTVTRYRKMRPEAARMAYIYKNLLSQIAGAAGPVMGPAAPGVVDGDDADDVVDYLPD